MDLRSFCLPQPEIIILHHQLHLFSSTMKNSQLIGKKRVRKTYPCPCEDCNGDYQTTQTIGKHTMRTAARHGAQDASYKSPPKPGCKWCTCPRHPNGKWVTNGTFYRHKQRIVRPPAIAAPVAIQSE